MPACLGQLTDMPLPSPFQFILIALATFRLTHFIVFDRLGYLVRSPFVDEAGNPRYRRGLLHTIGEGITCFWCCGVWVSALLYLGFWQFPVVMRPLIALLAVAGVQSAIHSWVQRNREGR